MLPTFLAQLTGGCYLAVGLFTTNRVNWKYLRLMAVLSLCLLTVTGVLLARTQTAKAGPIAGLPLVAIGVAGLVGGAWLFLNAAQAERIRASQRLCPIAAGLASLVAALLLADLRDMELAGAQPDQPTLARLAVAATTVLGAGLLGTLTAAMLLGHRYLTDTDMPIAPLRRLAGAYLAMVTLRVLWMIPATYPIWSGGFEPRGDASWFWLVLSLRTAVGLGITSIFAWMMWDCVKRRATQSATAMLYLSMVFVFLGELAGQYLMRTDALAL